MDQKRVGFAGTSITSDVDMTLVMVVTYSGVALMIIIIIAVLYIVLFRKKPIEIDDHF